MRQILAEAAKEARNAERIIQFNPKKRGLPIDIPQVVRVYS
jgi:hypothetical protein